MKNMNEKKSYKAPQMEIVKVQTYNSLLTVSATGTASDIRYGGLGGDDEYGD